MIEQVVNKINENILRLIDSEYGDNTPVESFGLSESVIVDEEGSDYSIPAIVDNQGECHYVFSDDDFSAGWYHRLLSKSYATAKGFGDNEIDIEIADILLVCWGFRPKVERSALQFEKEFIIPSIPVEAKLINSDFDSFRVIQGEFKKIDYFNKPEEFVFSLRYRIQYKFKRECLILND